MENLNAYPKYYDLAGRSTKSEKEFRKYLKREIVFYKKLHEQAIEKGIGGIKLKQNKNNLLDLDGFNLIFY